MLRQSSLIKVVWATINARDEMGSKWEKVFDYEDLPDLVTVPSDVGASGVKSYIESRYGYKIVGWTYWSAIEEARTMAENLYSGDPV